MQFRVRDLDTDTKQRLQVEEGYGDGVVAIDHCADGETEWAFVGYAGSKADAESFIAQENDPHSHDGFFKNKKAKSFGADMSKAAAEALANHARSVTPQEVRQQQRRSQAFEQLVDNVYHGPRVQAGDGAAFLRVTWEEFETMHKEYADAVKQGRPKDCEFQPLSTYHHKIVQTNPDGTLKRVIRRPFVGEVGVLQLRNASPKTVLLRDRGPGDIGDKYFQVPDTMPTGEK